MTTERLTISMPAEDAEALRASVAASGAESLSAYVTAAIRERIRRERDLAAVTRLWGTIPSEAEAWARQALGVSDQRFVVGES